MCCLLFSRNVKTNIQTKVYHIFSCTLSEKKTVQKPSNEAAATNFFSSVYVIGITCSHECFLFYVITGRHYYYKSLSLLWGFFQPPCCYVLWKKCLARGPYFTLSLRCSNSVMLFKNLLSSFYFMNFLN